MKREFVIISDDVNIGKVVVEPAGLYYDIQCRCKSQRGVIRIVAECADRQENIGICVPEDEEMVIRTKIPQKRLQSLNRFIAITETQDQWIPITEGIPIPSLEKILLAKFSYRNGKPGLSIPQAKQHKNP